MKNHGGSRPGAGRPKGVKNRFKSHRDRVLAICQRQDFNPLEELVLLYKDPESDANVKIKILCEILSHLMPKMKALSVQPPRDNEIIVRLERPPP